MVDCSQVKRLWEKTKAVANMGDYSDQEWCEDDEYSVDEYFVYILTWGPLKESAQKAVWKKVKAMLGDRKLPQLESASDIKFPLPWQNDMFERLVGYLKNQRVSAEELVQTLKTKSYNEAKRSLLSVVQMEKSKIVDCWLRDIIKLDAFPIDSNVRKVLKAYGVPDDSDFIVRCAESQGIPVREFARAVYDNADKL